MCRQTIAGRLTKVNLLQAQLAHLLLGRYSIKRLGARQSSDLDEEKHEMCPHLGNSNPTNIGLDAHVWIIRAERPTNLG
jgi:hypothetical protein